MKPRRGKSSQERRFTLFLVSSHGKSHSVSFGIRTVKVAASLIVMAAAALLLFTLSYRSRSKELVELRYMREVAESQREQIRQLEEQYSALSERIRQAELMEAQIRQMLEQEGLTKQSFSTTSGLGGQSRTVRTASRDASQTAHDMSAKDMGRTLYSIKVEAHRLAAEAAAIEKNARSLHQEASDVVARLRATPSIWPAYGNITSQFGWRRHPLTYARELHEGIDIGAPSWTPIRATADGTVTFAGYKYGYGWTVIVKHGYGYETLYAHCVKLKARVGDEVKRGDVIAYVGQSGSATGPHVHYEVRVRGSVTDPTEYLPDDSLEVGYSVR